MIVTAASRARARGLGLALLAFGVLGTAGPLLAQCPPDGGPCHEAHKAPGCDEPDCCALICKLNPACCELAWDQICADAAGTLCPKSGCPGDGDCFQPNGSPGCDDPTCCADVCAVDAFCCDTLWDSFCTEAAGAMCDCNDDGIADASQLDGHDCNGNGTLDECDVASGSSPDQNGNGGPDECDMPGDLDGNGAVDVDDLVALVLGWGPCPRSGAPCPGDLDGSGTVDVDDLVDLLLGWTG